jgi:hypothetical protein
MVSQLRYASAPVDIAIFATTIRFNNLPLLLFLMTFSDMYTDTSFPTVNGYIHPLSSSTTYAIQPRIKLSSHGVIHLGHVFASNTSWTVFLCAATWITNMHGMSAACISKSSRDTASEAGQPLYDWS